MTPAEQALFDAAMAYEGQEDQLAAIGDARLAVLEERIPEGFRKNLEQLVVRFYEASKAMHSYAELHPLGSQIRKETLTRLRSS